MIFDKIKKAISEQTGIDENSIKLESTFKEDLNIDSIDLVELIMQLEEEYDIEFDDDQADKLKSVGDVVEYINEII